MPYEIWAECPKCKKMARTIYEIDKLFGFRHLESGWDFDGKAWVKVSTNKRIGQNTIPQSNCIDCRSSL